MAMQVGMGLSRVVLLVGAGFTIPLVVRNGRLSDILSEIQEMIKSGEKAGADPEHAEALASQVRRLAMEVRQLASSRPITVLSGSGQGGNLSNLIIPAATLGALGYGYMWWKGISFSDLMYVTKRNMANAVTSMTKHLEQVSTALSATKRHLTQRIENLDGKLDEQKEISGEIWKEVSEARGKLGNIGNELGNLQLLVGGLDEKMNSIEHKQNFTYNGVMYLCEFVTGRGGKVPDYLLAGNKATGRRNFLGCAEDRSLKGLLDFVQSVESENFSKTRTEAVLPNDIEPSDKLISLSRSDSAK